MAATFDQEFYRFRNNDGNEVNATWLAACNTAVRLPVSTVYRVRFVVYNYGDASGNVQPQLMYSHNGGSYTVVSTSSSVIKAVDSQLTNGQATTVQLDACGTFSTDDFEWGEQVEDGYAAGPTTLDYEAHSPNDNYWTEVEFSFQIINADVGDGDEILLQVHNGSPPVVLDRYSVNADIEVAKPVASSRGRAGHVRPSYAQGFARSAVESENPGPWKGLVGLWAPSLGPTGITLHDWSGYKNNGTLTNMDPAADWVTSPYGYALQFSAADASVDITGSALVISSPITIVASCRQSGNSAGGFQRVFQRGTGASNDDIQLYIEDGGDVLGSLSWRSLNDYIEATIPNFSQDEWFRIVVTWAENRDRALYSQGALFASDTATSDPPVNDTNCFIGNWSSGGTRPWEGMFDDMRVYNRVWTPAEVAKDYADSHAMFRLRRRVFASVAVSGLSIPIAMRHYLRLMGAA